MSSATTHECIVTYTLHSVNSKQRKGVQGDTSDVLEKLIIFLSDDNFEVIAQRHIGIKISSIILYSATFIDT